MKTKYIVTWFLALGTIQQGMRFVKDDIDRHQLKGVYKVDCFVPKFTLVRLGALYRKDLRNMEQILRMEGLICQPLQIIPQK